jgi:hypothetical protein
LPDKFDHFAPQAARAVLLAATAATLWFAFVAPGSGPSLLPWDKARHFLAFGVLATLALIAFPRANAAWLGLGLSLFGAFIEVVQATPLVHRDCDVWDWAADTIAVLAVLAVLATARLRARLASSTAHKPRPATTTACVAASSPS